jgi:adenine/guanine phosphoribosyltransferase-like PRPP-binding protein
VVLARDSLRLVELYNGQDWYTTEVCGLTRKLPIIKVDKDTWIASNAELVFGCDIEFTETVGRDIANLLKNKKVECLLVPEVKGIPIAYVVARNLGHKMFAVARKSVKSYM